MKKRSWGWRLVAIAAGVALALGLVACGGDDDTAADTATAGGGGGITLNLVYVTTAAAPVRDRASTGFAKEVNATGQADHQRPSRATRRPRRQLLADLRSGAVDMATISSAVWDTGRRRPPSRRSRRSS